MDGQDEVIFSHKWEIQTGDNWKCCNLRSRSSKILISRTIPEQAWKSGFFQVHFQYQKNSRTIQGIQGIPELLATCTVQNIGNIIIWAQSPTLT